MKALYKGGGHLNDATELQETVVVRDGFRDAETLAKEKQNYQIDIPHLWSVMMQSGKFLYDFYAGLDIDMNAFIQLINREVDKISTVSRTDQRYGQQLSRRLGTLKQHAEEEARLQRDKFVTCEHYILALFKQKYNPLTVFLKDEGITIDTLQKQMNINRDGKKPASEYQESIYRSLERYAVNMNVRYMEGKLRTIIGRQDEIHDVLRILSRKEKNNAILVGSPGVGKTAIIEGLVSDIVTGNVTGKFKNKIIYNLDMSALVAGAKYRGEFEERFKSVLNEVRDSQGEIILFIDEIHTVVGAGQTSGAMDAGNILKPMLARGEVSCIGATTQDEYRENIEKDKALERRFQKVLVNEPDIDGTMEILEGIKSEFETYHRTIITPQAVEAAVKLSSRYITDRYQPGKAIDVLDEASAVQNLKLNALPRSIEEINEKLLNLKIMAFESDEAAQQSSLEEKMASLEMLRNKQLEKWEDEQDLLFDLQQLRQDNLQQHAEYHAARSEEDIEKIVSLKNIKLPKIKTDINSIEEDVPSASFINETIITEDDIAGVIERLTGIKVRGILEDERQKLLHLEDELKARVVGQDEAVGKVSNTVLRMRAGIQDPNKPSGSFLFLGPTGVGKTQLAKSLAESLFGSELEMVRLDMSEYMEKHAVARLIGPPPGYVGYDEGGQLTEAVQQRLYSIVLLDEIEKAHEDVFNILLQVLDEGHLTDSKGRKVDFKNTILIMTSNIGSHQLFDGTNQEGQLEDDTRLAVMDDLRTHFKPEFLNRIDEVIMFNPLLLHNMYNIVRLMLSDLEARLEKQSISLKVDDEVMTWLAVNGYDKNYGARPLDRFIVQEIETPIARHIIAHPNRSPTTVTVSLENDQPIFSMVKSE